MQKTFFSPYIKEIFFRYKETFLWVYPEKIWTNKNSEPEKVWESLYTKIVAALYYKLSVSRVCPAKLNILFLSNRIYNLLKNQPQLVFHVR